jgi:predicted ATP-dependent protease
MLTSRGQRISGGVARAAVSRPGPLKQSIAVTGSVNQHGLIQAVGTTNEKVEAL